MGCGLHTDTHAHVHPDQYLHRRAHRDLHPSADRYTYRDSFWHGYINADPNPNVYAIAHTIKYAEPNGDLHTHGNCDHDTSARVPGIHTRCAAGLTRDFRGRLFRSCLWWNSVPGNGRADRLHRSTEEEAIGGYGALMGMAAARPNK